MMFIKAAFLVFLVISCCQTVDARRQLLPIKPGVGTDERPLVEYGPLSPGTQGGTAAATFSPAQEAAEQATVLATDHEPAIEEGEEDFAVRMHMAMPLLHKDVLTKWTDKTVNTAHELTYAQVTKIADIFVGIARSIDKEVVVDESTVVLPAEVEKFLRAQGLDKALQSIHLVPDETSWAQFFEQMQSEMSE